MNMIEERQGSNPWYEIGACSIIGTRRSQQDYGYYYADQESVLAIVCDGMGGLEGGERASETAVWQLASDFREEKDLQNAHDFFLREVQRMDQAVTALKNEEGKPLRAGTTLVAAYFRNNQAYWVSVGDSKLYWIRGRNMQALNREHNYRLALNNQLKAGRITQNVFDREEKTPQADALTSFIGMGQVKLIDANEAPMELLEGDVVMLCSDGVWKSLAEDQICAMVRDNDLDMRIAAERLVFMAQRCGTREQDNTTVLLIQYQGRNGGLAR